jgi:hypothetical protein
MADAFMQAFGKLACDFQIRDNYFAAQAFARLRQGRMSPPVPAGRIRIRRSERVPDGLRWNMPSFIERLEPAPMPALIAISAS